MGRDNHGLAAIRALSSMLAVAYSSNPFLLIVEYHSIVWIYHNLFLHSLVNRKLCYPFELFPFFFFFYVGSSRTRARTRVPCISRQILNHCATREAPVVSHFKLLQIKLLWTLVYKSLCECVLSFLLCKCLGVERLGHMEYMFNFLRKCQIVLQSDHIILYSHQQCMKVLVPYFLTNSWYGQFFFFRHSNRNVVLSHCGCTLHFPRG